MPVERMPREMRTPRAACSEGCPGWVVFNDDEIQGCDACWSGEENPPDDDYFESFSECRAALVRAVFTDKPAGWLLSAARDLLEREGFAVAREWKVGDAARLYGERGVAWLVEEVDRDRLTVRLVGDDRPHHVWARDCEWLPPGSYCVECGQESCGHAREEAPEMVIDSSAILTRPGEDLIETVRDARAEAGPARALEWLDGLNASIDAACKKDEKP